jgi:hypothetical protein
MGCSLFQHHFRNAIKLFSISRGGGRHRHLPLVKKIFDSRHGESGQDDNKISPFSPLWPFSQSLKYFSKSMAEIAMTTPALNQVKDLVK